MIARNRKNMSSQRFSVLNISFIRKNVEHLNKQKSAKDHFKNKFC